mmetsp:Transcript_160285/g.510133  ORF Transcript_160285/g.510133 Transcript_160285/m.510133 type:complete len:400 (+) Transcript_160285:760-1959(+)
MNRGLLPRGGCAHRPDAWPVIVVPMNSVNEHMASAWVDVVHPRRLVRMVHHHVSSTRRADHHAMSWARPPLAAAENWSTALGVRAGQRGGAGNGDAIVGRSKASDRVEEVVIGPSFEQPRPLDDTMLPRLITRQELMLDGALGEVSAARVQLAHLEHRRHAVRIAVNLPQDILLPCLAVQKVGRIDRPMGTRDQRGAERVMVRAEWRVRDCDTDVQRPGRVTGGEVDVHLAVCYLVNLGRPKVCVCAPHRVATGWKDGANLLPLHEVQAAQQWKGAAILALAGRDEVEPLVDPVHARVRAIVANHRVGETTPVVAMIRCRLRRLQHGLRLLHHILAIKMELHNHGQVAGRRLEQHGRLLERQTRDRRELFGLAHRRSSRYVPMTCLGARESNPCRSASR